MTSYIFDHEKDVLDKLKTLLANYKNGLSTLVLYAADT